MIDRTHGFTLIREFDATPAELWDAWTNPDEAAAWWHPAGITTLRESVRIDARVGGRYTYLMVNEATGDEYPTGGTYQEIVEPERLVFTWGRPEDADEDTPLVTVTIEPVGEGRSRMVFDLRGAPGHPGDGNMYDGWASAFDDLLVPRLVARRASA